MSSVTATRENSFIATNDAAYNTTIVESDFSAITATCSQSVVSTHQAAKETAVYSTFVSTLIAADRAAME